MAESPKKEEPTNVAHRTRNAGRRDSVSSAEKESFAKKKEDKERAKAIREGLKSDYVDPLKRHLGPLQDLVAPHGNKAAYIEPMDFHLRKLAGLIVTTQKSKPQFSEEFIDELGNLASEYLHKLISSLHKYTEVQRHRRPGIHDLELSFQMNKVSPSSLYSEYERSKELPEQTIKHKKTLDSQAQNLLQDFYAEEFNLEKDDPSSVFHANDQYEVASLIPRQSERPSYIPDYFPTLPPDYTYQNTGSYMKTITELKQIKLKLVEESRLNERSLYKLIDREVPQESTAVALSDVDSDKEDIMSVSGEGNATDVETPQEPNAETAMDVDKGHKDGEAPEEGDAKPEETAATDATADGTAADVVDPTATVKETPVNSKRFDFVDYANRRKLAKERAAKKLAAHRKKREDDILLRREKLYSPYAQAFPKAEDNAFYDQFLQKSLKRVIRTTRDAYQKKRAKITELLEERAKLEKEQEKNSGSFEFGFAFNPNANVSDESEEEDEVGELDFGDDFKLIENRTDVAGKRPSSGSSSAPQTATQDTEAPAGEAAEQKKDDEDVVDNMAPIDHEDDVDDLENELDNALNETESNNLPAPIPFPNDMDDFESSDSESDDDNNNAGGINFGDNANAPPQTFQPSTSTTFEMNFPPEEDSEESEEDEMVEV
ncbi:hypothetical protein FT663_00205 [Candidozyma haemuli var. vulneris]|uniref:Transcription initiation factor TFIID subunit 8 n=1 Tax=Candidozyma haemuli TaxID=45357 RepID=A0A2V1APQ2_9ASCO|nr:hypothetical protein CXQ85_003613 [[Candida] haemuloni]KAF3993535.1 hypothetical protein FT662_00455 [[Candida] haemuloni var. vulneris]KAF3995609.1 hypothetical protein FT663_00205 [[Candida] haemuloni var. vulneris]PVH19755.1 hypothetical protein CXQ85_003613 [[Candida] haemuloni]